MRWQLAGIVLAAVIGTAIAAGQDKPAPPAPPANGPAAVAGAGGAVGGVPVKRVVLFTSGVGYFEHYGTIHGNASTVLSFKTDQINDVLKSLLLEDLDGGRVTGISYPTLAPLAQTLRSFQVDLTNDPPLADILKQLRGAALTVTLPSGPVSGQVLGVEKKSLPVGTGDNAKVVDEWIVNLLNESGIVPVDLDKVSDVKLNDAELAGEMTKALAAVAQARDKDKKPVTITFAGNGDQRVRIGYVVETPIWKASYRISLGEAGVGAGAPAPAPGFANVPADQQGKIQGWAVVDNQTDNDWDDVELSLISGRPISFIEDLYQPLFVPRPVVQPDLFAGLVPRTYLEGSSSNGGILMEKEIEQKEFQKSNDRLGGFEAGHVTGGRGGGGAGNGMRMGDSYAQKTVGQDLMKSEQLAIQVQVPPQASGAQVGEAFQYTVHDVTLARQKSSMIPILSGPMRTQRLSIYNASVLPNNPLLGARLTNNSGGYIMQGPVTVLDHGIYAGDAQVLDLPPDATRLISYGVDQRMQVNGGQIKSTSQLLTAKIEKGVLQLSNEEMLDQTYTAQNKADVDKVLLIEHPRRQDWQLLLPKKATETTDALYRFEMNIPAGKSASLEVQEQHVFWQGMDILSGDTTALVVYTQNAAIPQPVKDALAKAIALKQAVADTDWHLAQIKTDQAALAAEQARMRENMKVVSPGTDYYKKLLQKMDDQETQFEKMESQQKQLEQQRVDREKQLEDYLGGLTVG